MIRYFKIWVLFLGLLLAALVVYFAGSLFIGSCSYRNNCLDGGRAQAAHTPISTLIPVALQETAAPYIFPSSTENCTATAKMLLSAWVSAGFSENQPFSFSDSNNIACEAAFVDVLPLFTEPNLWFPGALACTTCHNANLSTSNSAGLDLSTYAGVVAGSHRSPGSASGVNILGAGDWLQSILNQSLFVLQQMPYGIPPNIALGVGPTILAGIPVAILNATPTEIPSDDEVARPSNPGGSGSAVELTGDPIAGKQVYIDQCQMCHGEEGKGDVLNPGSDDGTVPSLNPIDSTLMNSDYKIYAYNIDLFIQNGSAPAGPNPALLMPAWGAQNGLPQQQIADVIAYLIDLNK
jgi:mono/diheme cytochrome c family protein